MPSTDKILLKDLLFNAAKVERVAGEIRQVYPAFAHKEFVRVVTGRFAQLELKARIGHIAESLRAHLPQDYQQAVGILLQAMPPANDPNLRDGDYGDFIYAPYAEYVARYGCQAEHLDFSLAALEHMTMRFSAEDAIRYFINAFPEPTLQALIRMSQHPHYHVRRLCSEGTRPKLPWSQKLTTPIAAALPILDALYADSTRYVTRSVANHLNDIAKTDPDLVLTTLARWQQAGKQQPAEMQFITQHALRGLIKQGQPKALAMVGVSQKARVSIRNESVPKRVKMNKALSFSFELLAASDAEVIVDYILHFCTKTGKASSKKVFKLKKAKLQKGVAQAFTKQHMLRAQMTTRTLYPGKHMLEIQVNGKVLGQYPFVLTK